ncbi:MAG: adenosylcobinamide-GDP ribazoletransferase [Planctomycetota bacterium]
MIPRGLVSAIRTLSVLPVPGRDAASLASALPWFPLVGGLLALLAGLPLIAFPLWPAGAAFASVVLLVVLTGCIHLDGLADVADGLGCRGDRERTLAVMKDPRCGSYACAAVVLLLAGKLLALTRLAASGAGLWLIAAVVAARAAQVDIAVTHPYARANGTAAGFVGEAGWRHRMLALLLATLMLVVLGYVYLLALPAALLLAHLVALRLRLRLGGITGDVLGAASELSECGVLLAAAALAPHVQALRAPWPPIG